jgi:hypothetical protein
LLISEPEVRKDSGRRGKELVRQKYLWPEIAQQIERSYLQLCGYRRDQSVGPTARTIDHEHRKEIA